MTNAVLQSDVSFEVTIRTGGLLGLAGGSLTRWTVRGSLYRPASAPDCVESVLLLLHGISQGRYVWDFPIQPDLYSPARMLAKAGYPVVTIDRLAPDARGPVRPQAGRAQPYGSGACRRDPADRRGPCGGQLSRRTEVSERRSPRPLDGDADRLGLRRTEGCADRGFDSYRLDTLVLN